MTIKLTINGPINDPHEGGFIWVIDVAGNVAGMSFKTDPEKESAAAFEKAMTALPIILRNVAKSIPPTVEELTKGRCEDGSLCGVARHITEEEWQEGVRKADKCP